MINSITFITSSVNKQKSRFLFSKIAQLINFAFLFKNFIEKISNHLSLKKKNGRTFLQESTSPEKKE